MQRPPSASIALVLAGLSAAVAFTPVMARAAGFVGDFDPSQWTLVNTSDAGDGLVIDQTLVGAQANCGSGNDVACVNTSLSASGYADLLGSTSAGSPSPAGGGVQYNSRTSTWSITNPVASAPVSLSFSWLFTADLDATQTASYLIDNTETLLSSSSTASPALVSALLLQPGQTFGFRIFTPENVGATPLLNISDFTATSTSAPVPGPLPMAGGAAAFAWSRRLRQRIRQARL